MRRWVWSPEKGWHEGVPAGKVGPFRDLDCAECAAFRLSAEAVPALPQHEPQTSLP